MNSLLSSGPVVRFPLIGKAAILMFLLIIAMPGQVLAQLSCNPYLEMENSGEPFYEGDTVTVNVDIGAGNITGGGQNTLTIDAFHYGLDCAPGELTSCTSQGNTITYVPGSVSSTCSDGSNPNPIEFNVVLRAPENTILDFTPKVGWGPIMETANSFCEITFDLTIDDFVGAPPPRHPFIVFQPAGWSQDEGNCDNEFQTSGSGSTAFIVNEPAIAIEKSTNGLDSDTAPGESILVGDPVVWEYMVSNTGNVPLASVGVLDDQGVVVTCPSDELDIGESMTCTAPTGAAVRGQYTNIGTVSGIPMHHIFPDTPVGPPVTDQDPSNYLGLLPDFTIEKSSPQSPGPLAEPGTISYSYLVVNTGDIELTNLQLTDTNTQSAPVCVTTTLGVGQSTTCSATHEFTEEELEAGGNDTCGLYNLVTATTDQVGPRVDDLCIPVAGTGVAIPTTSTVGLQVMAALLLITGLLVRRFS